MKSSTEKIARHFTIMLLLYLADYYNGLQRRQVIGQVARTVDTTRKMLVLLAVMTGPTRATRVPHEGEALVQLEGDRIWCQIRDLSITGMAVISPEELRIDKAIWIGFDLENVFESVQAVVVRTARCPEGFLYGIQFKGMGDELFSRLKSYVACKESGESPLVIRTEVESCVLPKKSK
jgi:hypothetical protein